MFELSIEAVVVLFVVVFAVALSSSPSLRSVLLTVFGVLGFGIIGLALMACIFVVRSVGTHQHRVMEFELPHGAPVEVQSIQLDDAKALVVTPAAQLRPTRSQAVAAKKPTPATAPAPAIAPTPATNSTAIDSKAIDELTARKAEEITIDDQMRAEIEQQWRKGQLHDRLLYTGTGAATLIALIATLFGYLKLDLLLQAKHRRGLQAGAAGVILTVALVAALAAEGRLGF